MKIRHINSGEILEDFPYYYKWNSIYGYVIPCDDKVYFFYGYYNDIIYEDVSDDFEIIESL